MAQRITVSVPDGMAEWLKRQPDMSAFVAEAIRRKMEETTRAKLESVGFTFDEERLHRARREFEAKQAEMTPELKAWARNLIAKWAPHRLKHMRDD